MPSDEVVTQTSVIVTMDIDSDPTESFTSSPEKPLPANPDPRQVSSFAVATNPYDDAFASALPRGMRRVPYMSNLTKAKKRELEDELQQWLAPFTMEYTEHFRPTELIAECLRVIDNVVKRVEEAVVRSPIRPPHSRFSPRKSEDEEEMDEQQLARQARARQLEAELDEEKRVLDISMMEMHLQQQDSSSQSSYVPTGLRGQAGNLPLRFAMPLRRRPFSAPPGIFVASANHSPLAEDQDPGIATPSSLRRRSALQDLQALPQSGSFPNMPDSTESRPPPTRIPRSLSMQAMPLESVPELPSPEKPTPQASPIYRPANISSFYRPATNAELNRRFAPFEFRKGSQMKGFARNAYEKVAKKVENVVAKKSARDADDVFGPGPTKRK